MREAARTVGIVLVGPALDGPLHEPEYREVFASGRQEPADGLIVGQDPENFNNRRLIVELAEKNRLPAMYPQKEFVEIGGLMGYGIDLQEIGRRAADEIEQILKGAKPGEIPIYQPSQFELSINLKTAKTLGIELPLSLLTRANEMIE